MATEQGQGLLLRVLTAWVAGVCRRPWLVLVCSILVGGLSVYFACTHLEYQTQRNDLISPTKDFYKRWQQVVAEFGDDDDMVVVLQGSDKEKMKSALEELAGLVQKQPDKFDRLFYKVDLRPIHNRALLFLSSDQIRLIQDNLKNMGLLLDAPVLSSLDPLFSWKSLTLEQLLHEGERRVAAVNADPADRAGNADFLSQLDAICRTATKFLDDPGAYKNPWQSIIKRDEGKGDESKMTEPQYFLGGKLAFLLVHPFREDSFTGANKSVSALREVLAQVKPRYPDLEFGLTGQPVLENDEMMVSQKDSNTASWLALIGIALLYMLAYRSWRFPVFTVATLLLGTAWSLGWLTLTVGHLNILSASFVVMLIGIGDYGVLWITRYGQERERGADLETAMRTCAGTVGRGILTAGLTTALAFFATMFADFKAVEELGWIAGCGVFLCALACFIVLPALVTLWDRRRAGAEPVAHASDSPAILSLAEVRNQRRQWLPRLMRRPRLVVGVSLGLVVLLAICAIGSRYDHNLLHMQARGLDSVRWEETLIENTAGASWHALTYTTTPEEALALKSRFEKLPAVSMVIEAASLVPRDQERKLEQLKDIQFRLRRLPKRGQIIPHAVPQVDVIAKVVTRLLNNMMPGEQEVPVAYLALRQSLQGFKDKLTELAPGMAAQKLRSFEEALTGDLAEDLHKLKDVSTPAPITLADLPAGFRERYIGKTGKWLVAVFAKDDLWDFEPMQQFISQVQTVDPDITGKPITTMEGLRSMKNGFILAAVYAFIVIVLVLLFDFQSWRFTLLALAPLVMGLCAAAGIMTLLNIPFNPANMIVVPLIIGVGTDNGVHVLHDFRSRRGGVYTLTRATGQGIMVKALATVLGFGTLMISNHRGMYSLGLALTLGVTCCMLTALVFLPALLRLKSAREQAAAQEPARKVA